MKIESKDKNMNITNSKIGFGTYRIVDEKEILSVLESVCQLKYDFIDTAKHYQNEIAIGKALKIINQKFPNLKLPAIQSKIWPNDFKNGVQKELQETLTRLQIKKIDSFLLHRPHVDMSVNVKAWKELIECQKNGLVTVIGVSNFDRDQIETLYQETGVYPEINQIEANVTYMRYDRIRFCKSKKISVQGWRPFGKYEYTFQSSFLKEMSLKNNCNVAQLMLAYVINHQIIPVCRSNNIAEIQENIQAKNLYLTPHDLVLIEKHMNSHEPSTHNGCDSFANLSLDEDWYKTH